MACRPPARSSRQHLRNGNSGPAKRRDGVGPEGAWLVIEVIQGDPGNSPGFGRCPLQQGHRFARAGRAGDDGQRALPRAFGDQLGDPRPRHCPVRHTWRGDLGCQDGDVSGNCRPSGGGRHLPGNIGGHRDLLPPASGLMAARHGRPHVAIPAGRQARPAMPDVSPSPTTKRQPASGAHPAISMKPDSSAARTHALGQGPTERPGRAGACRRSLRNCSAPATACRRRRPRSTGSQGRRHGADGRPFP